MFTGIIEAIGEVAHVRETGGDLRLQVHSRSLPWAEVRTGDSIATNGVCLTVVEVLEAGFVADVSVETLSHSTIADWKPGQAVNLEQALTPQARLGGHFVSGHVDAVGEVLARRSDARSERFTLRAPPSISRYIAEKGSIAVDGISLTVNKIAGSEFELNIVPHTLSHTTMHAYRAGTQVNLEVDLIARYMERLLLAGGDESHRITPTFLAEHGFMK